MKLKLTTQTMATLSFLVALELVLVRFLSFQTSIHRIGFGFVPIVIAAVFYGPVGAGFVGVASDLVGAALFPKGPFFPGFTLTALLGGMIFGFFLYQINQEKRAVRAGMRIIIAVVLHQLVLALFLTTYWLHLLSHNNYLGLLSFRVPQCVLLTAIEIVTIFLLVKFMQREDIKKMMSGIQR